ncbi:hypothetical protein VTP01DRAFT_6835 [Rhizomucor pusillus]|uniref:uncharacterized protein n=1 Tax=Rhizomucor pusillus TaxID=4840 RepID=UPI0037442A1A
MDVTAVDGGSFDMEETRLTEDIIKGFVQLVNFKEPQGPVTSLSFSDDGELCVTTSLDQTLNIYNCVTGEHSTTLYSKKYGANLARFVHENSSVLYASTKEDDTIRYLSVHDNKYIRYFKGHTGQVTCLQMSPVDDTFISASLDNTVKIWDLRRSSPAGSLKTDGRPTIAFDPEGLVFAVGMDSGVIKVYDARKYESGPFATWSIRDDYYYPNGLLPWNALKFTNDGKHILVSTTGNTNYIIDAFEGTMRQRLTGHDVPQIETYGENTGFSPDSQFVFAGGANGSLTAWNLSNVINQDAAIPDNTPMGTMDTCQGSEIRAFGFNPHYMMMVVCGPSVAFYG